MSDDAELELFRSSVSCAALLEQFGGGWALDQRESTRNALKYRGGPGQVIIAATPRQIGKPPAASQVGQPC